jgi:hypothetical protein
MPLLLPLKALTPKEPESTWQEFCSNPMRLFEAFAERYVVDASQLKDSILSVKGDNVPEPADRAKIWIKTSWPYAIGVVIDGTYKMDWGLSEFPVNTPFLYLPSNMEPVPEFVHLLSSQEISDFGLTDTSTGGGSDKRLRWYIFEPEDPIL